MPAFQLQARSSVSATPPPGKPKTPMIAGAVCGGFMGLAYLIGFTIYFVKRYKRKKLNRRIKAGKAEPKTLPVPKEKIVIPPDPAVLLGQRMPGERVVVDDKRHWLHAHRTTSHVKGGEAGNKNANSSASQLVNTSRPETPRISDEITVPADVV